MAAAAVLAAQSSGTVSPVQQAGSATNIQSTGTVSTLPVVVSEEVVETSDPVDLNK